MVVLLVLLGVVDGGGVEGQGGREVSRVREDRWS
jgi:hypothetical protein